MDHSIVITSNTTNERGELASGYGGTAKSLRQSISGFEINKTYQINLMISADIQVRRNQLTVFTDTLMGQQQDLALYPPLIMAKIQPFNLGHIHSLKPLQHLTILVLVFKH